MGDQYDAMCRRNAGEMKKGGEIKILLFQDASCNLPEEQSEHGQ